MNYFKIYYFTGMNELPVCTDVHHLNCRSPVSVRAGVYMATRRCAVSLHVWGVAQRRGRGPALPVSALFPCGEEVSPTISARLAASKPLSTGVISTHRATPEFLGEGQRLELCPPACVQEAALLPGEPLPVSSVISRKHPGPWLFCSST